MFWSLIPTRRNLGERGRFCPTGKAPRHARKFAVMIGVCMGGIGVGSIADEAPPIDFPKLTPDQRFHWLDGAALMAIHLAAMHDKKRGDCAADWYLDDVKGRQALVELKMRQYPTMGPTTIIIGLMAKACGPLVPKQIG